MNHFRQFIPLSSVLLCMAVFYSRPCVSDYDSDYHYEDPDGDELYMRWKFMMGSKDAAPLEDYVTQKGTETVDFVEPETDGPIMDLGLSDGDFNDTDLEKWLFSSNSSRSLIDPPDWLTKALTENGLPIGASGCRPDVPKSCANMHYVRCLEKRDLYGTTNFVCGCDYQHTLVDANTSKPRCVKNVLSPCNVGRIRLQCGENMVCLKDTLGIDNDYFCRCKDGYRPVRNSFGIPAFCHPEIPEEEESEPDYQESHSSVKFSPQAILPSILVLLLLHK